MVNFYTLTASGYDVFEDTFERVNPADYGALVFLSPLPACVLSAAVFFGFRNIRKKEKTPQPLNIIKTLLKIAPCIVSLSLGSVWLSLGMLFEKSNFHTTIALFIFYTVLGFVMYVASEVVLLIMRQLIGKSGGTEGSG